MRIQTNSKLLRESLSYFRAYLVIFEDYLIYLLLYICGLLVPAGEAKGNFRFALLSVRQITFRHFFRHVCKYSFDVLSYIAFILWKLVILVYYKVLMYDYSHRMLYYADNLTWSH